MMKRETSTAMGHYVPKSKFDLPPELWSRTLVNLDTLRLHALLTVCRAWHAIAEPLMFRDIKLKNLDRLRTLALRVVCFSPHSEPLTWIRELWINFVPSGNNIAEYTNLIIVILAHARSLELYNSDHPINASVLSALTCSAGTTIRELGIDVALDDNMSQRIIHQFQQLRSLELALVPGTQTSTQDIAPLRDLCLHHLTHLNITWPKTHRFSSEAGETLASLQLKSLESLVLNFAQVDIAAASSLSKFLQSSRNPIDNKTTTIGVELPATLIETLKGPLLQNYTQVTFTNSAPAATFLNAWHIGYRCRILHLEFSINDGNTLWSTLDAFAETAVGRFLDSGFALAIRLKPDEPVFTWGCRPPSTTYAAFVGQLMYHARALDRIGIRIMDGKGYTLYDDE